MNMNQVPHHIKEKPNKKIKERESAPQKEKSSLSESHLQLANCESMLSLLSTKEF